MDLRYPESWSDLVQESEKDVLKSVVCVNGNQILVSYLSDVTYVLQVWDLQSGKLLHNFPIDIGPGPTIGKAPTSSRCILTVSLPPLHGISTWPPLCHTSDHNPLLFCCWGSLGIGLTHFMLEIMWCSHPSFRDQVKSQWSTNIKGIAMFRIAQKLEIIRRNVKG